MSEQRQINVDQRVSRESLPGRRYAAEPVNDPSIPLEEIRVRLQIILMRHVSSATLRANVDLPPPAFPNTATFFMSGHAYAYVRDQRRWACLPRSG